MNSIVAVQSSLTGLNFYFLRLFPAINGRAIVTLPLTGLLLG